MTYLKFQYRKRYEVTCDSCEWFGGTYDLLLFQYRKRYEVTCDGYYAYQRYSNSKFQYRKRYEVTCDLMKTFEKGKMLNGFNTASGMRSHATGQLHS